MYTYILILSNIIIFKELERRQSMAENQKEKSKNENNGAPSGRNNAGCRERGRERLHAQLGQIHKESFYKKNQHCVVVVFSICQKNK